MNLRVLEQPADTTATTTTTEQTPATTAPATTALSKPTPLHELIPEKFHVKNGEQFDTEASARKVLEGYQALEKRVGSGDLPPKAPEEYTIPVPEAMKEAWQEDERTTAFRKEAHEAGLTQKQFDLVMGRFFKIAPELMQGGVQNSVEATIGSLEKSWGGEYDKNLTGAMKAFEAYADPADKGKFDEIMRDPSLAYRVLAKVSREMGEAGGVPNAAVGGGGGEGADALMKSEAYWNTKHPDHAKVSAQVKAHYAKKYGDAAVN